MTTELDWGDIAFNTAGGRVVQIDLQQVICAETLGKSSAVDQGNTPRNLVVPFPVHPTQNAFILPQEAND